MKIAILTRSDFRSPRLLADSLRTALGKIGVESVVFPELAAVSRLQPYARIRRTTRFHFWLRRKLRTMVDDRLLLRRLREFDAIVVCECTPNAFWKDLYDIEKLRNLTGKPILLYEVYYLGNAPSQIERLKAAGDPLAERYDWHLAVSPVTEIRLPDREGWSCIGLDLTDQRLNPNPRKEFVALVDFLQPGHEESRAEQIRVLKELGIRTIELEGEYSREAIRELYSQAAVLFIQFPEAFGVPIAECLANGTKIFAPDERWPMSWRLLQDGEEQLPDVFTVYSSADDLKARLTSLRDSYDLVSSPCEIAEAFKSLYPTFFAGDRTELQSVIERIRRRDFQATAQVPG